MRFAHDEKKGEVVMRRSPWLLDSAGPFLRAAAWRAFGIGREVMLSVVVFVGRTLWPILKWLLPRRPLVPEATMRPVIFVPGCFKNASVFWWLVRGLRAAGWRNLVPVEDIGRPWRAIEDQARDLATRHPEDWLP